MTTSATTLPSADFKRIIPAILPMVKKKPKKKKKTAPKDHVVVTNNNYGAALKGHKIYFERKRPGILGLDGRMTLGKHILEALTRKYKDKKFRWTLTEATNSIATKYGIIRFNTSVGLIKKMQQDSLERGRDIKTDIVQRFFSIHFPTEFQEVAQAPYVPGTLAKIVDPSIVPRLSSEDKEALAGFLPDYVSSEAVGTVEQLKATAQIETLTKLAANLEEEMGRQHPEEWWQKYIKANILLMQQGYIKALDKLNTAIGETKFPDFCLVTHDNYLDILEIKKPNTPLLKLDDSRGNYYWDTELSKAVIQTENYIAQVHSNSTALRSHLLDKEKINIKVVRPRGIILAGDARGFSDDQKQRDDFRLLSQGIKNVTVVTYDELLTRLKNYIGVLEQYAGAASKPTPKANTKKRA